MLKAIVTQPQPQPHSDSPSSAGDCYSKSPSPSPCFESGKNAQAYLRAAPSLPAISLVRPSRVSSSVNPRILNQLRRKFVEQSLMTDCDTLPSPEGHGLDIDSIRNWKGSPSSPNTRGIRRTSSFKGLKTKLCRVGSDGIKGYDPLPAYDDLWFPRERITSVNRALGGKTASLKASPRPYRPRSLIPAANRVILFDSGEESEEESNLDFVQYSSWRNDAEVSCRLDVHSERRGWACCMQQ